MICILSSLLLETIRYTILKSHYNQNVLLKLPNGLSIRSIRWLAIWCRSFSLNFGHVTIPANFEPPKSLNLGPIRTISHGTSADAVIIMNSKTVFLRNLYYDGEGPGMLMQLLVELI